MGDTAFGVMSELFRNNSKNIAAAVFDLAWKMISGRLSGSQKAQSLAGLKRCIEDVLGDDDIEPRKVSALVTELSEILPKMSAAF